MTTIDMLDYVEPPMPWTEADVVCDGCGGAVEHADEEYHAVDGLGHLDCTENCAACGRPSLRGSYVAETDLMLCVPCHRLMVKVLA